MTPEQPTTASNDRAEFFKSLRNGILLGLLVLAVVLPFRYFHSSRPGSQPAATVQAPASKAKPHVPRLADFGGEDASADARHVANWALHSGDNQGKAVVVVDKKAAKVYAFNPEGKLLAATPALLGSAHGDHSVPGIGERPIPQILPEERTTPAGRFIAEPGRNANGEDIVWVDYNAAVSMHRVRPLVKAERRLERLASPTADDNRISYGCINLPVAFYEGVLSPTVQSTGAVIYVLPETSSPQEFFKSYDTTQPALLAQR